MNWWEQFVLNAALGFVNVLLHAGPNGEKPVIPAGVKNVLSQIKTSLNQIDLS